MYRVHSFRFLPHISYHRVLNSVLCAIQSAIISHLSYIWSCVYISLSLLAYPFPPFPFGNHKFVCYKYD